MIPLLVNEKNLKDTKKNMKRKLENIYSCKHNKYPTNIIKIIKRKLCLEYIIYL